MNSLPNFLIIGAMKCATSSLHTQLALQPGIFMSDLKEPNFFSDDTQYEKGIEWYSELFQSSQNSTLRGESSTHYTKLPTYPETIKRIQQHLGNDIKFVYVMRHPINRLISQYIHEWSTRVISVDINQAIYEHPELISYSQYSTQIQPYLDTFGHEYVLPVFFEQLLQEPQSELERICNFIGYSKQPTWDLTLDAQNVSSQRLKDSAIRDFLVNLPILSHIRQSLVPKDFRTWVRSLWTLKEKPQLQPEQLEYLTDIFDKDLEKLAEMLGITNLSCKTFKNSTTSQVLRFKRSKSCINTSIIQKTFLGN